MSKLAANVKEALPHGAQKVLAERLKISPYKVNRALNGGKSHPLLHKAIAEYMEELAAEKKEAAEKINQAIAVLES